MQVLADDTPKLSAFLPCPSCGYCNAHNRQAKRKTRGPTENLGTDLLTRLARDAGRAERVTGKLMGLSSARSSTLTPDR